MWARSFSIRVQDGQNEKAAALARELERLAAPVIPWRVYLSETGERPILVIVMESETWEGLGPGPAIPGFAEWHERFNQVTVAGTRVDQIWRVF